MSYFLSIPVLATLSLWAVPSTSHSQQDIIRIQAKSTTALGYDEYRTRASSFMQQKNYVKAISDLGQAIAVDPKNPAAYFDRGRAYYEKEDFEKAAKDFDAALALDQGNPEYKLHRGLALNAKRDFQVAFKEFDDLIQQNPNNAAALDGRGMVAFNTGNLGSALIDFNQARSLDPNNSRYLDHVVAVYAAQQSTVVATIDKYQSIYAAASNDLQKDAVEDQRGREICQIVPSKAVSSWAGRITKLDTSAFDNVHVEIDFGNGYTVENGVGFCIKCTIQKYGTIWNSLVSHSVGDTVYFSGEFEHAGSEKCIKANNLMQYNRMKTPGFFMVFSSIR